MGRIFISHKQGFGPARALENLINMLGGHGILVEDEPGAESPDDKSFRLLRESDGFIAICTNDITDVKTGETNAKQNVILEIKEWQRLHNSKNMVIIKEVGCKLPVLLSNPTYCEYSNEQLLEAACRALQDLQAMGVLSYKKTEASDAKSSGFKLNSDGENILKYLVRCPDKTEGAVRIKKDLSITETRWNVALSLLDKANMIYINYQPYEDDKITIAAQGIEYLVRNGLVPED